MSKLLSYFKYNDSERCKLCKTPYQNSGGKDGNKDEYLKQIKEAEEYQRLLMLENNITSYDSMIHNDAIYTSRELSRYTILLPIEFIDINNNEAEIDEKSQSYNFITGNNKIELNLENVWN
ncbi:6296_t:CDS:2 [Entrophospora sp. SA101]|nr:6296_t:CDS:2 [Entrophospora sp. SA101]